MSGSPTAAEIRLREAEERRLAKERHRKAEEERRRREEAERRARADLANKLRITLTHEAAQLRVAVSDLRAAAADGKVPGGVPHIEPEIDIVVAAGGGGAPETMMASLGKIRALARSVALLGGHVALQASAIASEQDALRRESAAEAKRLASATKSEEAERHRIVVAVGTELRARIAGIEADDVAMTWSGDEVAAVREGLHGLADSPRPSEVAAALGTRLDAALARAQDRLSHPTQLAQFRPIQLSR